MQDLTKTTYNVLIEAIYSRTYPEMMQLHHVHEVKLSE